MCLVPFCSRESGATVVSSKFAISIPSPKLDVDMNEGDSDCMDSSGWIIICGILASDFGVGSDLWEL